MMTDAQVLSLSKLKLNIDHAPLEEYWMEGYEDGQIDVDESANPYKPGSKSHQQWTEGWWAAYYGEEPLYALDSQVNHVQVSEPVAVANKIQIPFSTWIQRFIQFGCAILVAALCYELADMAT